MLKLDELKKMRIQDLDEEFDKTTKELFKLKFEVNTGSEKGSHQIGNLKKYRAQILTVKNQLVAEKESKFDAQAK
ncbi:50S ribosomal protein L29 [bacterium]|nr:50S ribosomal protein L29 [bacterium]